MCCKITWYFAAHFFFVYTFILNFFFSIDIFLKLFIINIRNQIQKINNGGNFMLDSLLSLLMTFILLILSIFGGTGDGVIPEDEEDTEVSYNYTIYDEYFEFKNLQYGENLGRNILDLYIPRTNTKCEMGLVLYIHGGGWIMGDKDTSGYSQRAKEYALENGYACAAMNYSYLSKDVNMNDILEDITDALTAIHFAGKQVAVTIEDSILYGYSAGAHLALQYAYTCRDDSPIIPAAVISIAAPTNLTVEEYWTTANDIHNNYYDAVPDGSGRSALQYILSCATGSTINSFGDVGINYNKIIDISPVNHVKNAVPTVIVHGRQDVTVPYSNAVELDAALTAAYVAHDFISYDNYGHNVGETAAVLEEVDLYLDYYTNDYLVSVADLMPSPELPEEPVE